MGGSSGAAMRPREVRNYRAGFFLAENALIDTQLWARLSPRAAKLYVVLLRRINSETRICWPSKASLMRDAGFGDETGVRRALRELEHVGLLATEHVVGGASVYNLPPVQADTTPEPEGTATRQISLVPEGGSRQPSLEGSRQPSLDIKQTKKKQTQQEKNLPAAGGPARSQAPVSGTRATRVAAAFAEHYQRVVGTPYPAQPARDRSTVKALPEVFTTELLVEIIPEFFREREEFYARTRTVARFVHWLSSPGGVAAVRKRQASLPEGEPLFRDGKIYGYRHGCEVRLVGEEGQ